VPEGERWEGVPARRVGRSPEPPAVDGEAEVSPSLHGAAMVLLRCGHVVLSTAGPAALGFALAAAYGVGTAEALAWLAAPRWSGTLGLALAALTVVSIPLSLALDALACRVIGRVAPGTHSLFGRTAIKVWVKTAAVESAHRWLCGALLWPAWLRAAGMRIGRGCEISTVIDVVPETIEIGEESFFADGVYLCGPRVQRGTLTVSHTRIGKRTFLGNHAVLPPGHDWPDDLFVGVSTAADPFRARPGTSWFGTPAMELPHREVVKEDRRLTHDPDLLRWSTRAFFETLRLALPLLPLAVLVGWLEAVARVAERMDTVALLLLGLPAVTLLAAAIPCAAVVALKWTLLGRVRPGRHAFWSCWCGRWDIFYVAWEVWAREILTTLDGTLLLNAYLRLTGMRIGRRVALGAGHAQVVDPDMIVIEDDATVSCQFQAHTFEDRVLKIDTLRIGRGATVGDDTVVFFGADVGNGARVAPNGVVMKRDLLPADGVYEGCPTAPALT
jgi:non-ribosomal peptide synthetase-like protein